MFYDETYLKIADTAQDHFVVEPSVTLDQLNQDRHASQRQSNRIHKERKQLNVVVQVEEVPRGDSLEICCSQLKKKEIQKKDKM